MPTSSAKPARLLQYRNRGLEQVEEWEPEVGNLRTALSDLRTALSGMDLPENCQVQGITMFYENWYESLTQAQRHLDEWVGDVGNGFLRAEGINPAQYDISANLNESMSVDDSEIVVGYADMYESEAQAREDARALDDILGEYGLIHPYELANNPELLEEMAEQYPELRDILARSARFADDESYAAELVNTLGPQNVRTMADLTNTFGLAQDRGLIDDDAYLGYVVPFAAILANADHSGRMDDSVRDAIFDMDATDEEPIDGLNVDSIQEGMLRDMRYRSLALLMVGDFSPQTTAEMADAILGDGPIAPTAGGAAFPNAEGFTDPLFLENHQALASNQYSALVALQGDDHAANLYYSMDEDGDGQFENLSTMWIDGGLDTAADRLNGIMSRDEVDSMIQETLANGMRGGILEYPLATGDTYSDQTVNLVTQMIETAGYEHADTSNPVRQALAQISTPYTTDIAIVSAGGGDFLPETRLPGLDQGEIDAFMQEVSESEHGRMVLSQNAAALVREQIGASAGDIANDRGDAFGVGEALSTAYYTDLGEAWNEVQVGWVEQREALVAGWQTVTDPVLDLVSGKIVESLPGGDLPIISDAVDGISGEIKNGINDAVYNHFIPQPELENMQDWRDAIGDQMYDAVGTSLYENQETYDHYLERVQDENPELWAEINSDGEITAEEFYDIPAVQDAVQTYGGEILDGFQSEMAFDQVFPKED